MDLRPFQKLKPMPNAVGWQRTWDQTGQEPKEKSNTTVLLKECNNKITLKDILLYCRSMPCLAIIKVASSCNYIITNSEVQSWTMQRVGDLETLSSKGDVSIRCLSLRLRKPFLVSKSQRARGIPRKHPFNTAGWTDKDYGSMHRSYPVLHQRVSSSEKNRQYAPISNPEAISTWYPLANKKLILSQGIPRWASNHSQECPSCPSLDNIQWQLWKSFVS